MKKNTPKTKTTKPEPTAAQMYATRRNDIARLIDVLQARAPQGLAHHGLLIDGDRARHLRVALRAIVHHEAQMCDLVGARLGRDRKSVV